MSAPSVWITKPIRLIKATNALEPMDIDTIDGKAVSAGEVVPHTVEVDVPDSLSDAAEAIGRRIKSFADLLAKLNERQQDIETTFPKLVKAYKVLLASQHSLYLQAKSSADTLVRAQRRDFETMRLASDNFAHSVKLALQAAEETQSDKFRELAAQAEWQAHSMNEFLAFVKGLMDEQSGTITSLPMYLALLSSAHLATV